MVDTNAVAGLTWVKGDIVTSLQRVHGWLEDLAEGGGEESRMSDAVSALGEVRGVLLALQLAGPARLTEEMQTLCEDLAAETLSNPAEAAEALLLALIQLPDHLDNLEEGEADVPLALLPAINDLRGSRGLVPLSEAELLVPASVLAESETPAPKIQKSLGAIARKIRPYFHLYLLQWMREDTSREGLVGLGRLFYRLKRQIGEGIFHELFLVAEAVVEALLEGSIAANSRTRALVAHLDRVIKPFATEPSAWPEADAHALLFDLLSLIARCKSSSYRVNELRTIYGLDREGSDEAQALTSLVAGPDPKAVEMLAVETREGLLAIRDALDLFTRGDREDKEPLLALEPHLFNLASTLAVTGTNNLADRLRGCAGGIGELGRGSLTIDDQHLRTIAQELLSVEAALDDLAGSEPDRSDMGDAVDALGDLVAVEAGERPADAAELIARSEALTLSSPAETGEPLSQRSEPKIAKVIPWPAAAQSQALEQEVTPEPETTVFSSDELEARAKTRDEEAIEVAALADVGAEVPPEKEILAAAIPEEVLHGDEILAAAIPEEILHGEEILADEISDPEPPLSEEFMSVAGHADDGGPAIPATDTASPTPEQELVAPFLEDARDIVDRLAQQGCLMGFRLGELDGTVDRLHEQLRQLEMEIEAQILSRCEPDSDSPAPDQEGADPQELDRFSTLQQLSRSLAETVDDLVSLRTLLRNLQRESDTLL